ncbi:MAG TPA: hypothetical protein VN436_13065, partial [Holophaga sp.]|nr:hypothetical protein [Holophaga sp.]
MTSARILRGIPPFRRAARALASPWLTVASLVVLMVLVTLCTLAQTRVGLHDAVQTYMRSFLVLGHVPGLRARVPLFPGGILAGLAMVVNLAAALACRFGH